MPKRTAAVIATAVLLFGLAGCAATPDAEPPAQKPASETPAGEMPEAEAPETPEIEADEAAFIAQVREKLRPDNIIPNATDDQLLAAGYAGCERLNDGEDSAFISVIEGEEQHPEYGSYLDSITILTAARAELCP